LAAAIATVTACPGAVLGSFEITTVVELPRDRGEDDAKSPGSGDNSAGASDNPSVATTVAVSAAATTAVGAVAAPALLGSCGSDSTSEGVAIVL
jgi:hypothetical protein